MNAWLSLPPADEMVSATSRVSFMHTQSASMVATSIF